MQVPPPRCPRASCRPASVVCEARRAATAIPFILIYVDYCHKTTWVWCGAPSLGLTETGNCDRPIPAIEQYMRSARSSPSWIGGTGFGYTSQERPRAAERHAFGHPGGFG